jgi:hypothetical protein
MFTELKQPVLRLVESVSNASKLTYASFGVGVLFAILLFKLMFRGPGDLREDVDNLGKSPLVHRDYDYVDVNWSKMKIVIWLGLSVAAGWAAHYKLPELFPTFFR